MSNLGAIDWTVLALSSVEVGDIVSADAGGMPIYRVEAFAEGKAWLRDLQRSTTQILAPLDRFHWKAAV